MHLSAIYIYPIKSLRGISVAHAHACWAGLRHDRRWMIVDSAGRMVSQRQHARLVLVDVEMHEEGYRISVDGRAVVIPEVHDGSRVPVSLWGSNVEAVVHAAGSAFFSDWLNQEVRLVHFPQDVVRRTSQLRGHEAVSKQSELPTRSVGELGGGPGGIHSRGGRISENPPEEQLRGRRPEDRVGFADGYPYLLIGESSLQDLRSRLPEGTSLEMAQFRPNLVVAQSPSYAEDGWAHLRVGGVSFRGVKRCERCVMTTIDPRTAEAGREPLRTLASYRREGGKVWFGMNLCPDSEGELRVGDVVVSD